MWIRNPLKFQVVKSLIEDMKKKLVLSRTIFGGGGSYLAHFKVNENYFGRFSLIVFPTFVLFENNGFIPDEQIE